MQNGTAGKIPSSKELTMKTWNEEEILEFFNKIEESGMSGNKNFELNENEMMLVYDILLEKLRSF